MVDRETWDRTVTSVVDRGAEQDAGFLPSNAAALLDALADVVMAIDAEARLVYVNRAAELLGWDRSAWIGRSAFDLIHPDDLAIAASAQVTMQSKQVGTPIEIRIVDPRGTWRLFEVVGSNHLDDELGVMVLACRDIGERRRWEVAAGDIPRFQAVVHHSTAITMLLDVDGRVHSVSAALTRLTGLDPEVVVGARLSRLAAPGHEALLDDVLHRRPGQTTASVEVPVGLAAGGARPFRFEVVDLRDDPVVQGFVVTAYDVSELHSARDALQQLATHDALTGLPNRIALTNAISDALVRRGDADQVGLLFVDLDRFKPVNDLFGHDAGDELLIAVSTRLHGLVRFSDTVARIGGDEFVVMLGADLSTATDEAASHARSVAEKILAALNLPYLMSGEFVHCSASLGVALFNDHHDTVDELLKRADQAMYQAKAGGRNTLRFFDTAVQQTMMLRAALEAELRLAVQRDELVLCYQPVIDHQNRLLGAEALVRWKHPRRGLVSPAEFIPIAEDRGLIQAIGRWVLETACTQLATWAADPATADLVLSVNVSARELHEPQFVERVIEILACTGARPARLKIELTENAVLDHVDDSIAKMKRLKAHGIRLALDDFGTGLGSLSLLKRLPLDELKIDRTFVQGLLSDTHDAAIARAIAALGLNLGISVVAEGVETAAQRDLLIACGCRIFQGDLFGPPAEAEALARMAMPK